MKRDIDLVVFIVVMLAGSCGLTHVITRDHILANLEIECPEKPLVKATIEKHRVMCYYADIPARKDRVKQKPAVKRSVINQGGNP